MNHHRLIAHERPGTLLDFGYPAQDYTWNTEAA